MRAPTSGMISAMPGIRCPSSWSENVPFPVSMTCWWTSSSLMKILPDSLGNRKVNLVDRRAPGHCRNHLTRVSTVGPRSGIRRNRTHSGVEMGSPILASGKGAALASYLEVWGHGGRELKPLDGGRRTVGADLSNDLV